MILVSHRERSMLKQKQRGVRKSKSFKHTQKYI